MILKTFLGLILLTLSTALSADRPYVSFVNLNTTHLIECQVGQEFYLGTAFQITPTVLVTAGHVTGSRPNTCLQLDQDKKLVVYDTNSDRDVSLLATYKTSDSPTLKYSCQGFHPGETYYSLGYAHGKELLLVKLTALKGRYNLYEEPTPHGFQLLTGLIYSGMSGGPILNSSGIVIGINNASNYNNGRSLSRPLQDTSLCQGS